MFASANYWLDCMSLLDSLHLKGGRGIQGAAEVLVRSGMAGLLSASFHEQQQGDVYGPAGETYYPYYSTYDECMARHGGDVFCQANNVTDLVNTALESADQDTMLDQAATLDRYNNGIEYINWVDPTQPPPTP